MKHSMEGSHRITRGYKMWGGRRGAKKAHGVAIDPPVLVGGSTASVDFYVVGKA